MVAGIARPRAFPVVVGITNRLHLVPEQLEPLRRRAARWGVDHEAGHRGPRRRCVAGAGPGGACRLSGAAAWPEQGAAGPLPPDLPALFARTGAGRAGARTDP